VVEWYLLCTPVEQARHDADEKGFVRRTGYGADGNGLHHTPLFEEPNPPKHGLPSLSQDRL